MPPPIDYNFGKGLRPRLWSADINSPIQNTDTRALGDPKNPKFHEHAGSHYLNPGARRDQRALGYDPYNINLKPRPGNADEAAEFGAAWNAYLAKLDQIETSAPERQEIIILKDELASRMAYIKQVRDELAKRFKAKRDLLKSPEFAPEEPTSEQDKRINQNIEKYLAYLAEQDGNHELTAKELDINFLKAELKTRLDNIKRIKVGAPIAEIAGEEDAETQIWYGQAQPAKKSLLKKFGSWYWWTHKNDREQPAKLADESAPKKVGFRAEFAADQSQVKTEQLKETAQIINSNTSNKKRSSDQLRELGIAQLTDLIDKAYLCSQAKIKDPDTRNSREKIAALMSVKQLEYRLLNGGAKTLERRRALATIELKQKMDWPLWPEEVIIAKEEKIKLEQQKIDAEFKARENELVKRAEQKKANKIDREFPIGKTLPPFIFTFGFKDDKHLTKKIQIPDPANPNHVKDKYILGRIIDGVVVEDIDPVLTGKPRTRILIQFGGKKRHFLPFYSVEELQLILQPNSPYFKEWEKNLTEEELKALEKEGGLDALQNAAERPILNTMADKQILNEREQKEKERIIAAIEAMVEIKGINMEIIKKMGDPAEVIRLQLAHGIAFPEIEKDLIERFTKYIEAIEKVEGASKKFDATAAPVVAAIDADLPRPRGRHATPEADLGHAPTMYGETEDYGSPDEFTPPVLSRPISGTERTMMAPRFDLNTPPTGTEGTLMAAAGGMAEPEIAPPRPLPPEPVGRARVLTPSEAKPYEIPVSPAVAPRAPEPKPAAPPAAAKTGETTTGEGLTYARDIKEAAEAKLAAAGADTKDIDAILKDVEGEPAQPAGESTVPPPELPQKLFVDGQLVDTVVGLRADETITSVNNLKTTGNSYSGTIELANNGEALFLPVVNGKIMREVDGQTITDFLGNVSPDGTITGGIKIAGDDNSYQILNSKIYDKKFPPLFGGTATEEDKNKPLVDLLNPTASLEPAAPAPEPAEEKIVVAPVYARRDEPPAPPERKTPPPPPPPKPKIRGAETLSDDEDLEIEVTEPERASPQINTSEKAKPSLASGPALKTFEEEFMAERPAPKKEPEIISVETGIAEPPTLPAKEPAGATEPKVTVESDTDTEEYAGNVYANLAGTSEIAEVTTEEIRNVVFGENPTAIDLAKGDALIQKMLPRAVADKNFDLALGMASLASDKDSQTAQAEQLVQQAAELGNLDGLKNAAQASNNPEFSAILLGLLAEKPAAGKAAKTVAEAKATQTLDSFPATSTWKKPAGEKIRDLYALLKTGGAPAEQTAKLRKIIFGEQAQEKLNVNDVQESALVNLVALASLEKNYNLIAVILATCPSGNNLGRRLFDKAVSKGLYRNRQRHDFAKTTEQDQVVKLKALKEAAMSGGQKIANAVTPQVNRLLAEDSVKGAQDLLKQLVKEKEREFKPRLKALESAAIALAEDYAAKDFDARFDELQKQERALINEYNGNKNDAGAPPAPGEVETKRDLSEAEQKAASLITLLNEFAVDDALTGNLLEDLVDRIWNESDGIINDATAKPAERELLITVSDAADTLQSWKRTVVRLKNDKDKSTPDELKLMLANINQSKEKNTLLQTLSLGKYLGDAASAAINKRLAEIAENPKLELDLLTQTKTNLTKQLDRVNKIIEEGARLNQELNDAVAEAVTSGKIYKQYPGKPLADAKHYYSFLLIESPKYEALAAGGELSDNVIAKAKNDLPRIEGELQKIDARVKELETLLANQ